MHLRRSNIVQNKEFISVAETVHLWIWRIELLPVRRKAEGKNLLNKFLYEIPLAYEFRI
jgi:hypothetical protein